MIEVLFADNAPIISFGVKNYFGTHQNIKIKHIANNYYDVTKYLAKNNVDVLVFDVELSGFDTVLKIKDIIKDNKNISILLFSNISELLYAPAAKKAGVKGYISKNCELNFLAESINQVHNGNLVFSEIVNKSLETLKNSKKDDRLFKKLSDREAEVLRYYSEGKKNKEVAVLLNLDEKTISTYKLRLQKKLNVNNVVDLLKTAEQLGIIC